MSIKKNVVIILAGLAPWLTGCGPGGRSPGRDQSQEERSFGKGTFGYDMQFLRQHHDDLLVLEGRDTGARIIVAPAYQARVMTSTATGMRGQSYGWINYEAVASDSVVPHMNPYGGEERFWLGPEGGQYALFFEPGSPFDFEHWQTPGLIDTAVFPLVNSTAGRAVFEKKGRLRNYAGMDFNFRIRREISMLEAAAVEDELGTPVPEGLEWVAYATDNRLKNTGEQAWEKEKGLLSVWLLGMFNPSPETVIVIPLEEGGDKEQLITDDYFGEVPADRLDVRDSLLLFMADGKERSKIGVSPRIAKPLAASFDFRNNVLTVISFGLDPEGDYVNSKWEHQETPYGGDAVNAYNDGPLEDGSQMGPFYELESSSAVKELKPGEEMGHRQATMHFEGDYAQLNELATALLGIDLDEVRAFIK